MNSEQELIRRIKLGERDAFREFVENHKKHLYTIAYRLTGNHNDADDLSQVVFIKFFKSIAFYRQESNIISWLYKIAVNSHIDSKRKKIDRIVMTVKDDTQDMTEESALTHSGADNNLESHFIKKHLDEAMKQLSPREKTAFILRHYEDHTIREIAEIIET
ncbi:MAG: RNA polymerase sigma factor [Calditrichaeota bacterium]|nr:RNA polymerase sigma factor [Calditrichota bacterium]